MLKMLMLLKLYWLFNILVIIYYTFFIVFIYIFFLEIPRWTVHFVHGWRQDVKKINEVTPISNFLRIKRADHLYNFYFSDLSDFWSDPSPIIVTRSLTN